jgi:hypothetical protein
MRRTEAQGCATWVASGTGSVASILIYLTDCETSRSPLSHIPVLRGTYASCYRQSYSRRSSLWQAQPLRRCQDAESLHTRDRSGSLRGRFPGVLSRAARRARRQARAVRPGPCSPSAARSPSAHRDRSRSERRCSCLFAGQHVCRDETRVRLLPRSRNAGPTKSIPISHIFLSQGQDFFCYWGRILRA